MTNFVFQFGLRQAGAGLLNHTLPRDVIHTVQSEWHALELCHMVGLGPGKVIETACSLHPPRTPLSFLLTTGMRSNLL